MTFDLPTFNPETKKYIPGGHQADIFHQADITFYIQNSKQIIELLHKIVKSYGVETVHNEFL